jgi:hypothetical protein
MSHTRGGSVGSGGPLGRALVRSQLKNKMEKARLAKEGG